ncbi:hypothetical protein LAV84_27955 [Rhizobium sp. VS19-DR104.2]|uniref:hypothetical protein n=1 Tax=Rhizobium/Agrobacterium group TaxID=227290 RepID=UPI001CC44CFF|nr:MULTISPECIES: hypothetical protein [unclassified Rhizobium]MBZ5763316.1 hypothetical protein [Rhizobium sp. VS19-DR96]MBZ5769211.1 hypothetical protein [Rhizobium sp. VS19-DR129.2]MBZ5776794.1 hypothetical protein [Rhizobium sp. VS19-DRK62.2]MBZ5788186.1 hypothetical protein [Rhizobium sp. VS19-DR121]MBZ5805269.1 hypothetical protein [Rhizobium sp. VS19-DR181]
MRKTSLFIGFILALGGLSGVAAVAGPADPAKAQPTKQHMFAANEVHAAYDATKHWAVVDVNDRFLIKSSPAATGGGKVQFAFLDGTRAQIGTCADASKLKPGDRRTTFLYVTYSKPDAEGQRQFELRRTLDFYGHDQVYRFRAGDGTLATLEPGVRMGLKNGTFVYEQATGPIGTSGKTEAVRVSYQLTDKFSEIASSVEMDRNRWVVSTSQPSTASPPIYSVNSSAVVAHVPGTKDMVRDRAIVANPTRGNGIGAAADAFALKVSGQQPPKGVEGLQMGPEKQVSLCLALPCSFDFQCNGQSTFCTCHDLSTGPQLGTCLS